MIKWNINIEISIYVQKPNRKCRNKNAFPRKLNTRKAYMPISWKPIILFETLFSATKGQVERSPAFSVERNSPSGILTDFTKLIYSGCLSILPFSNPVFVFLCALLLKKCVYYLSYIPCRKNNDYSRFTETRNNSFKIHLNFISSLTREGRAARYKKGWWEAHGNRGRSDLVEGWDFSSHFLPLYHQYVLSFHFPIIHPSKKSPIIALPFSWYQRSAHYAC